MPLGNRASGSTPRFLKGEALRCHPPHTTARRAIHAGTARSQLGRAPDPPFPAGLAGPSPDFGRLSRGPSKHPQTPPGLASPAAALFPPRHEARNGNKHPPRPKAAHHGRRPRPTRRAVRDTPAPVHSGLIASRHRSKSQRGSPALSFRRRDPPPSPVGDPSTGPAVHGVNSAVGRHQAPRLTAPNWRATAVFGSCLRRGRRTEQAFPLSWRPFVRPTLGWTW